MINDLYKRLETIFVNHTTHQWKNGWENEGDRLSKELYIQNNIPYNNLFLLVKTSSKISLSGPQNFKIELNWSGETVRIDIEAKQINGLDIYYFVNNELDWLIQQDFIIDLCQNIYDSYDNIKKTISYIPKIYGKHNPEFAKEFHRERLLNELI